MSALFAFEDVVLELGGRRVLDGVIAELPDEGVTCLVGPSGSGTSTLLRLCNRLEVPTSGVVRFRGEDVAGLDPRTTGPAVVRAIVPTLAGGPHAP